MRHFKSLASVRDVTALLCLKEDAVDMNCNLDFFTIGSN